MPATIATRIMTPRRTHCSVDNLSGSLIDRSISVESSSLMTSSCPQRAANTSLQTPKSPVSVPSAGSRYVGPVRIATWNVNSIRSRIDRVTAWIERSDVDVLALQETKCTE
ncbi:MAG: endonuclease/exonuclease/phosphatase family protein, partial [Aeromicrobium sp.]